MPNKAMPRAGAGNGCKLYKKCGGCQLQNLTYPEQLAHKRAKCIGLLGRFAHVGEVVAMDEPFYYRCKVQSAFAVDRNRIISGIYQSSTHKIVPVDECLIEDKDADAIIRTVRSLAASFSLGIFNEKTLRGFLRHVLIRKGKFTGEIMVVLVTGTVDFPKKNDFLKMLLGAHPNITTVVQNINNSFTAMVLGERNITLYGDGFIRDTLCGLTFRISPNSFYQVNPVMAEKLYTLAVEGLSLTGKETVIDAYCGTGTIGLIAAKKAKEVLGVEQNASAVKDAEANARENDIKNEKFFRADSGEFMVSLAEEGIKVDAVITDPPRAGCDLPFLRSLIKLSPEKVAYVSCNPETLARDLGFLTRNGYKVKSVTPVDMFPHTDHVETVVLMSRVNK